jgi:superfamily II helicase
MSTKTNAATAAERWKRQYYNGKEWRSYRHDSEEIYNKLKALGDSPEPEEVNKIIGNDAWTRCTCDNCGNNRVREVLQVGQEPDYESSTANICAACLKEIVERYPNIINSKNRMA